MPPVRLPRVAAPLATEAWYAAEIERIATVVAELVAELLLPVLRELAAEQARADADDAPPPVPIKILQGLDRFRVKASEIAGKPHAQVVAQAADKVEVYNGSNVADVARGLGLSVKPVEGNAYLQAARSKFMRDNTALIKDIPEEMRQRIEDKVRAGVESGKRWETLAKDLEEEGSIGQRRARLIARDQVNKYNGALTQARQQKLGISHFRWQGAMDARERPEHIALNGKVFAWDAPPPCGAPGQPIQCRCVAIPVVSDAEKAQAVTMTEADLQAATQQALVEHKGRAKRVALSKPSSSRPSGSFKSVTEPANWSYPQPSGPASQLRHPVLNVDEQDRLTTSVQTHLKDIELLPEGGLDLLHAVGVKVGIADGPVSKTPEYSSILRNVADRYGQDVAVHEARRIDRSRSGSYNPGLCIAGIGNGYPLESVSVALHELMHALDLTAWGRYSSTDRAWQAVWGRWTSGGNSIVKQLFPVTHTEFMGDHGPAELFAELGSRFIKTPAWVQEHDPKAFDLLTKKFQTLGRR